VTDASTQARSVDIGGDGLTIVWSDDHVTRFALQDLRLSCPCAECRDRRARGEALWPREGVPAVLEVTDAELAGAWGLSLTWNDRHETGIFPWETLRAWCPCEVCAASRASRGSAREG
jgi:DUF971 family protein